MYDYIKSLKFLLIKKFKNKETINKKDLIDLVKKIKIPVYNKELSKYLFNLDRQLQKITGLKKPFNYNIEKIITSLLQKYKIKLDSKLINTDLKFLQITARKIAEEVASGNTLNNVLNKELVKVYNKGLAHIDISGRKINIDSYTRIVAETELQKAKMLLTRNRTKAYDYDLCIVMVVADGCEICSPFNDEIISVNGKDPLYRSLNDIIALGFQHPNCRCDLVTYIPDIKTDEEQQEIIKENLERPKKADDRDYQRYLERKVREFKVKEALTTGEKNNFYDKKVKEYQGKLRELVKDTGRVREYGREKV